MVTQCMLAFSTSVASLRKLFLICVHPGDGPNSGCQWQQSGAGWRLLLEVSVYAPLGGPSSGAGLAGQRWAAARGTAQLLSAQWCHGSTELEANTHQWWGERRPGEPSLTQSMYLYWVSVMIHNETREANFRRRQEKLLFKFDLLG